MQNQNTNFIENAKKFAKRAQQATQPISYNLQNNQEIATTNTDYARNKTNIYTHISKNDPNFVQSVLRICLNHQTELTKRNSYAYAEPKENNQVNIGVTRYENEPQQEMSHNPNDYQNITNALNELDQLVTTLKSSDHKQKQFQ